MQKLTLFTALIFSLFSCNTDRLDVNITNIEIPPVQINRLERDLFQLNSQLYNAKSEELKKKYGNFYPNFMKNVVNYGNSEDSIPYALHRFINDPDIKDVYNNEQEIYTDAVMAGISDELQQSFKYFHYHFPKEELPKHYTTFISGFNSNFLTHDSTLGIGLDLYLGAENKYYKMLQWPKYKTMQLSKDYLVADCMKAWLYKVFDKNEPVNNLLNHVIFYGKFYYCLDAVLPKVTDSIKIVYTSDQLNYCKKFEKDLWLYFTEKDRLYKNDLKEVSELTADGPFTSSLNKNCPPRIAQWIGWQIVKAYMKRHKEISLEKLMSETDPQKILAGSKYKP